MDGPNNWTLTIDVDRVAWLECDIQGSSANVLSAQVLQDLSAHLGNLSAAPPAGVVVCSAKAGGFIAGADIREFQKIHSAESAFAVVRAGQTVLQQLEDLPCPTAAALHGYVLGGGLELSLACSYRIGAHDGSLSLGFPEVLLGIHPGFGGTVRAVRLVGVRPALDLMLKGKPYKGARALEVGLIDELVPPADLRERAKSRVLRSPPKTTAPFVEKLLNMSPVRPYVARQTVAALHARVRRDQYPAPYAIVDLWQRHGASGAQAYISEARSISELMCTDTSRNLVRVFLLQERLKGLGGRSTAEFSHLHVIGAGVMGGDIAAWAAYRGLTVSLQDRTAQLIEPAMERAKAFFAKRLKDPAAVAAAAARLSMDVSGDGALRADLVVEAIVENIDAKRALYAVLEPKLKTGAILATNTSSINIETLAAGLRDPGRLVGIHFFNPVSQLQLVEIVHSDSTRQEAVQGALKFARRLDKLPLPCKSAPGFLVNRVLTPYINEALFALEGGIPAALIDQAGKQFGMPVGPIELTDMVGLDVSLHVGQVLAQAMQRRVPDILRTKVEQKKFGRKSGEGFYVWRDGKIARQDVPQGAIPEDLQDRLILALLNEAVACLRQGIVADADLLDAGMVFATGFAPFRGGPLQYAKTRGIAGITARLQQLAERYGERFLPDPGWSTLLP